MAGSVAAWQNFYLLVGTAAATLIGLMFVAVGFGANLVSQEATASARAFLDPPFTHFVQVLLTACLLTIPTLGTTLLGVLLLVASALRLLGLVWVFRHMRAAHRKNGDLELSDWLTGAVLPLLCYLLLAATGAAFLECSAIALNGLAIVTLVTLLNGVYGAWELMVWLALVRARTK